MMSCKVLLGLSHAVACKPKMVVMVRVGGALALSAKGDTKFYRY
jgi:hypothetical protein